MTTTINVQHSYLLPHSTPNPQKHHVNSKSHLLSSLKLTSNNINNNNTMFYYNPSNKKRVLRCKSSYSDKASSMKEQKWVHEGVITESLPNGMFWVQCENGDVILGYVSGKIRRGSIRILPGDKVKIEVSRYDSTRGRIIYRTRS